MLAGTLNKIREEKASRIRDVEYIREMVQEDSIDDRFFDLEMKTMKESGNIYAESAKDVEQIPTDTTFYTEEVNRLLNADHTLSFDEMLGIDED